MSSGDGLRAAQNADARASKGESLFQNACPPHEPSEWGICRKCGVRLPFPPDLTDALTERAGVVAALFVERDGCYSNVPGVDLWDEKRDARLYNGPYPVVAHPPCQRWCRFAKGIEKQYPQHKVGDDEGCFESALESVRRFGGVLEHPAHSLAWAAFGLPVPYKNGGWVTNIGGGWAAYVEQGRYGHPMRKATWLYATVTPELRWGHTPDNAMLGKFKWGSRLYKPEHDRNRPRIDNLHSATPVEFRDALISIAKSAREVEVAA